jgi:NADH dehydrogenase [ubiquinone] 1 alpha subcomplex assembly factor 7
MRERLVDTITRTGPMFFDAYMDACLYDPHDGFFSTGKVRSGATADFLTSPEVSSSFGLLVGTWAARRLQARSPVLIEIGAGSGALLQGLAPYWFSDELDVYAVEVSSAAREAMELSLSDVSVVASFDDLPSGADAVVVVNEVLDNLPAALARRTARGWVEIAVDAADGELVLVDVSARSEVISWCDEVFGTVAEDTVVSVQIAARWFVEGILERFERVSMCIIDYGASAIELAQRDISSIVRTYGNHRSGHDWLAHPSQTDITVDVNTTAIELFARAMGASVSLTSQREFLFEHGIGELIDDAIDMERHHASGGRVMEQLVSRSERVELEALIDVDGLGGFQVMLIESGT